MDAKFGSNFLNSLPDAADAPDLMLDSTDGASLCDTACGVYEIITHLVLATSYSCKQQLERLTIVEADEPCDLPWASRECLPNMLVNYCAETSDD